MFVYKNMFVSACIDAFVCAYINMRVCLHVCPVRSYRLCCRPLSSLLNNDHSKKKNASNNVMIRVIE